MSYDKYRNWPTTYSDRESVKDRVLKDLEAATDPVEKLEILDSFEVYVQRIQQREIAGHWVKNVLSHLMPFIVQLLDLHGMPSISPICRPRKAEPIE